ncbi:TetR/AcrR family transcriptional regulator [Streptomyces carpaticus]|uniref:TetR/AcrR family transcriptional regulator n=1 Tax=Streptomyces carpaticus TaxID=285558 RepID=A0ABV4ZNT4_9ACTN
MPGRPSQNPPVPPPEALRADARHNRERILAAAGAVFAERGIDVPMTTVARRAGVGVATLYRRFPTRDALVAEVFSGQLATCVQVLDDALTDPDPWDGFRTLVERLFALQVAERGFTAAVVSRFPHHPELARQRARAGRDLAELVRRAQAAGRLRADFRPADLLLALRANCGIVESSSGEPAAASRRLAGYLLDSFRVPTR